MSLEVKTAADGKSIEMNIRECFNFDLHRQFRDACVGGSAPGCSFRINLAVTEYMDSSALGMFLLLKIARFDQLFRIEG